MQVKHSNCGTGLRPVRVRSLRRAVVVVQVAVLSMVFIGMAALSIDIGYTYICLGEMQAAMDASALAGASAVLEGDSIAGARAIECATQNVVAGYPVSGDEVTVVVGSWEWGTRTFYAATEGGLISPNAVRVIGARPDVPLFCAPALGVNSADVVRGATALVGSGICAGVWGLNGITGDGDIVTDSYNSQNGPYGPGNVHANGDLCSCQNVDLHGGVQIRGDAMYGNGYALTTYGSAYEIWGIVDDQTCGDFVPEFDIEGASIYNDNGTIGLTDRGRDPFGGNPWDLVVTGNDNLTLAGGTYYFTSVLIDGQATLTIAGPTEIYLAGTAEFTGGGVANLGQDPADLIIYSAGPMLDLSGNADFYGAVIAPAAQIVLRGTSDVYGTLLGGTLAFEGTTNIHVDESLVFELFGLDSVAPVLVE